MSAHLYIAAKAPRIGIAKTRLGRSIGDAAAIALYRAFLQDLGARFADAPFPVGWYVTPDDAWPELRPLVGCTATEPRVLAQGAGDWAERQDALFRDAPKRNEAPVILIASDSPHLTIETIQVAFRTLNDHDLVFGPVSDGGYYLIGMRRWHDVLKGIPMSTGSVLDTIRDRARAQGLSVGEVAETFDVDDVEDLVQLQALVQTRDDLPATRRALEALCQRRL